MKKYLFLALVAFTSQAHATEKWTLHAKFPGQDTIVSNANDGQGYTDYQCQTLTNTLGEQLEKIAREKESQYGPKPEFWDFSFECVPYAKEYHGGEDE